MNLTAMARSAPPAFAAPVRLACISRAPAAPETLGDLLRLLGESADDAWALPPVALPMRRLHAGMPLFVEGARPEALYAVRFGAFKSLRVAEDGYEQVLGFSGPTELIGFEGLALGWQPSTVLALEESAVHALPAGQVDDLRHRVPAFDRALQRALGRQLARRAELAELMAAVAAEVRLARFLMQLSNHAAAAGRSPRDLRLSMGRRDIASYLGVAHETVSRAFGALSADGYLSVSNRDVLFLDLPGLEACARVTRGPAPAPPPRQLA